MKWHSTKQTLHVLATRDYDWMLNHYMVAIFFTLQTIGWCYVSLRHLNRPKGLALMILSYEVWTYIAYILLIYFSLGAVYYARRRKKREVWMIVFMYICMLYVCMCIYIYIYVMYLCMCSINMWVCVCACIYVCVCMYCRYGNFHVVCIYIHVFYVFMYV